MARVHASVEHIHPQLIARYSSLGPLRTFKRKRELDGTHEKALRQRLSIVQSPTFLALGDTQLTAEQPFDDEFESFGGVISVDVDVFLKIKNGLVCVHSKKRGQMKEQELMVLSLNDPQELEKITKEVRVVSNNKVHFADYFKILQKPILEMSVQGSAVKISVRYTFEVLETLYLDYPLDIATAIRSLVENTTELQALPNQAITPKLFYDCITKKTLAYPESVKPPLVPELDTDLLRFQGTTVNWMLGREHVTYNEETRSVEDIPFWTDKHTFADDETIRERLNRLSYGFELIQLPLVDTPVWYNKYSANVCSKDTAMKFLSDEATPKGRGILSEEMGLGKTVELVALILLNQRPLSQLSETVIDAAERVIPKSKTTLIVCPDSILSQWSDEITLHAPSLSTMVYNGASEDRSKTPTEVANEMSSHDIVVTSYSVMAREVHNAKYNPARAKRARRATTMRRDLSDELKDPNAYDKEALDALKEIYDDMNLLNAQPEERTDYSSPLVLLEFWRMVLDEVQMVGRSLSNICTIATLIQRHHSWGASGTPIKNSVDDLNSLLTFMRLHPFGSSGAWKALLRNQHDFTDLFSTLTFRHTKTIVKNDINIPPQNRVLLSVPFGPIEQNNYDEMYKQLLSDVGLDEMGNPIVSDWEPTPAYYETMRSWLAVLRRLCCHPSFGRESGPIAARNFQTMDKVLERMIAEASEQFRETDRTVITARLEIGQIYEFMKVPKEALAVWIQAHAEIEEKLGHKELHAIEMNTTAVRSTLELLHRALFFMASAHYQLYTPPLQKLVPTILNDLAIIRGVDISTITEDTLLEEDIVVYRVLNKVESEHQDLERHFYAKAQEVRKKLLSEPIDTVNKGIMSLNETIEIPALSLGQRRFEDVDLQAFKLQLDSVLVNLNSQAMIINRWCETLMKMLKTPLLDTVTDPSGEEYAASLNDQEYTSTFLTFIQRVMKDREELVLGKASSEAYESVPEGSLFDSTCAKELENEYPKLSTKESLRNLLVSSRALIARNDTTSDLRAFTDVIIKLKDAFEQQKELCEKYKKHFRALNNLYNTKINYFRQLQEISDNVKPFDQKTHKNYNPEVSIRDLTSTIQSAKSDAKLVESRIRYLNSLRDDASKEDNSRHCVICRGDITIGSLTACGHQYCKDCLGEWLKKRATCPVCKLKVKPNDIYSFTFNRPAINVKLASQFEGSSEEMYQIYQHWDPDNLQKLNEIKLKFNHGSKVNIIVRQVLWLKRRDPNVQIVIYSQWTQLLNIIGSSLKFNGVEFLSSFNALERFGSGAKTALRKDIALFKKDPRITCFLLNANAEASGLNLINATHVFLCEPLVQTALELQAISRIHRIGQKKPTTAWMFTISGTVEESIVLLSTRRRLEFKEQLEEEELAKSASSLVKTGGEFVDSSDLWNSFFSHKVGRLV